MTVPDHDRPEQSSLADVTLVTRGLTLTACVEVSTDTALVVRPAGARPEGPPGVQRGDTVELYWVSGYEERTLPARIRQVEEGLEPRWWLEPTGPAERSQRRKAVRGRVALPVVLTHLGASLAGTTVDISEGGVKALVDGWGLPPDSGTRLPVSVTLDDSAVDLRAEVVWHATRGVQWLVALRFLDVPDRHADAIRRRVFRALREERAHTVD